MALKQTTKATVTTTKEISLKPTVRKRLLSELRTYADLKERRDAIDEMMATHKESIGELRESTGEDAIELEGFKISRVSPIRKVLNHAKLVELGCAVAWIEEATESRPTKAYEKITVPGGRDE